MKQLICLYCNVCLNNPSELKFGRWYFTCETCKSTYNVTKFHNIFTVTGITFDLEEPLYAHFLIPLKYFPGVFVIHNKNIIQVEPIFSSRDNNILSMHKDEITKKFSKLKNFM